MDVTDRPLAEGSTSRAAPSAEVSFIIPAFNEAAHIAGTVARIRRELGDKVGFEIIVVDHGSSDATVQLAQSAGARVLVHPDGTIGSLRNVGVHHATGSYLVFLDADIRLTAQWAEQLPAVLDSLRADPRVLTGWMYGLPEAATWIERSWYDPAHRNHRLTYLESGNLITTRAFFEELGGFDESLRTGEDYELSMRAIAAGGRIIGRPHLAVEHLGYPGSLRGFVATEMWHGRGDTTSIRAVLRSKVAQLTLVFVALHAALVYTLIDGKPKLTLLFAAMVAGICLGSAAVKFRGKPATVVLTNTWLYYFYFVGRGLAFVNFTRKHTRPRRRKRDAAHQR